MPTSSTLYTIWFQGGYECKVLRWNKTTYMFVHIVHATARNTIRNSASKLLLTASVSCHFPILLNPTILPLPLSFWTGNPLLVLPQSQAEQGIGVSCGSVSQIEEKTNSHSSYPAGEGTRVAQSNSLKKHFLVPRQWQLALRDLCKAAGGGRVHKQVADEETETLQAAVMHCSSW